MGLVSDFGATFYGASSFNADISGWNTASATIFHDMFHGATSFAPASLNNWVTDKVFSFGQMFAAATNFNAEISDWRTNNALTFQGMFTNATSFNQPIPWGESTANVLDIDQMFLFTNFNHDLSSWNTMSVTTMQLFLARNSAFNSPMFQDVSSVESMSGAFLSAISFNQNLSGWNVSKVTNMESLFFNAMSYAETLCWDLKNLVVVSKMFCGSQANFDTKCVTSPSLIASARQGCAFANANINPVDDSDSIDETSFAWGVGCSVHVVLLLVGSILAPLVM